MQKKVILLSFEITIVFLNEYLFSFLLTINLKLIIVHVEIKNVNKEAATKRSDVVHGRRTFKYIFLKAITLT